MATSDGLSREFRLVAACCRTDGPERNRVVRHRAQDVDWTAVERLTARHRVEGLVQAALTQAGVVPATPVADALRRTACAIAEDGLRMAAESARLQAALDRAGIVNLVLKGATLDLLAWGRIGVKRSWDIDLLVLPSDARRARAVVEGAGYELEDPGDRSPAAFEAWVGLSKEAVFRHLGNGRVVELHWRATDVATLLPGLSAASAARTVDLAGSLALRTFGEDDLFAYLCVHGASHGWSRLKWLADLGALLAGADDAGRERLWRRAGALGAGRCPTVALLLCESLLGLEPPAAAAAAMRADHKATRLAALAIDAMAGDDGAEIATRRLMAERILLSHRLFADGWSFRLAEARRQAVSVEDHMRLRLPRRWSFLYGPLRAPLFIWRRVRRTLRRP